MIHNQHYNTIYIASCCEKGGIYCYHLFCNGTLEFFDFVPMDRPMYMVKSEKKLYILLRAPFPESAESGLVVYDIDESGKLKNPSEIVSTKGEVACHLCVHGHDVYCTNYSSGNLIKMPSCLVQHHGKSIHPTRQTGPHPHYVGMISDQNCVCVTDLGLDTVFLYDTDLRFISKASVPQGHGARHLAVKENYIYCANELKSSLSVFEYKKGTLEYQNTVEVLPADFDGLSMASAIRIKDDFCYIANRGHDSISVLDIKNRLHPEMIKAVPCDGNSPRDFNIVDDILICANEQSDNVSFFKLVNGIPQKLDSMLKIKSAFCVSC